MEKARRIRDLREKKAVTAKDKQIAVVERCGMSYPSTTGQCTPWVRSSFSCRRSLM